MNEKRNVASRRQTWIRWGACLLLGAALGGASQGALGQGCPLPVSPITPVCGARQAIDCTSGVAGDTCVPLTLSRDSLNNIIFVNQCTCADSFTECGPINVTGTGASTMFRCAPTCNTSPDPCNIYINGVSTGNNSIGIAGFAIDSMVTCACDAPGGVCPPPPAPLLDLCTDPALQVNCDTPGGTACVAQSVFVDAGSITATQCMCDGPGVGCGPVLITPLPGPPADVSFRCSSTCTATGGLCRIFVDGAAVLPLATSILQSQVEADGVSHNVTCQCPPPVTTCNQQGGTFWCAGLIDTDCVGGTGTDTCLQTALTVAADGTPLISQCACFEGGQCGIISIVQNTVPPATSPYTFICEKACPNPNDVCEVHLDGIPQGTVIIDSNMVPSGQTLSCGCVPPVTTCPLPSAPTLSLCASLQSTQCLNPLNAGDECLPTSVVVAPNGNFAAVNCACNTLGATCDAVNVTLDAANQEIVSCESQCPVPTQACLVHVNGVSAFTTSIPASSLLIDDVVNCNCTNVEIGACCIDTGTGAPTCVDSMADYKCLSAGGTFFPGGACQGIEACCDPTTSTCRDMDALCCNASGGIPQGTGTDCTQANICNPPFCPVSPNTTWCDSLQTSDCVATTSGTTCLPSTVAIDAAGVLVINSCNCFAGECGPVTIIEQPGAFPPYIFTCANNCPNPNDTCEIHIDGVPQGLVSLGSNWVPNGQIVSCGCVQPPTPCPLPVGNVIPLCQADQLTECTNPTSTTDECLPGVVIMATNGTLVGQKCQCATQGDTCGPVNVVNSALGFPTLSCEAQCPDPTTQNCLVHINGASSGLATIDITMIVSGDVITCNCEPQSIGACCSADAAGGITCQDGVSQVECDTLFGVFHPNESCLGPVACCRPDGTCSDVDALCCKDFGGVPQPAGSDCTQANMCSPPYCPLPANDFTCANFQLTDCAASGTNTNCMPSTGAIDLATGTVVVTSCDCFDAGECGPVTVIEQPGAFPPYIFTCKNNCPGPGDNCEIHIDGVPQGVDTLGSNWVPNGQTVSCGCVQTPAACPLPGGNVIPVCQAVQSLECVTPNAPTDECLPKSVVLDTAGTIIAAKCACITDDGSCGPVNVIDTAVGITLSCVAQCPDPTTQECMVHQNGISSGVPSMLLSNALPGAVITCDCLPPTTGACCSADAAGGITCQDGVSQVECDTLFGVFHPNESCLGPVACCRPDGTCSDVDALCCKDFGGVPQPAGSDCTQANMCSPPYCPVSPNTPWCVDLQATDCPASGTNTDCLPNTVAIDLVTGAIVVDSCSCYVGGECGPVTIIEQPGIFPPYIFTCENNCPDPNDKCEIHIDGVPQGVVALGSNWVPNGQIVSCGCVQPNTPCPLPGGDIVPVCQAVQSFQCVSPDQTTDECLPLSIALDANGAISGAKCACITDDGTCGPVKVIDTLIGITISCEAACPDPTSQACMIHQNGVSAGVPSMLLSAALPGAVITCDCIPPTLGACCSADAAGIITCQDNLTEVECDTFLGFFHPNESCLGTVACCMPDGTCRDIEELCCENFGGSAQPAGSNCSQANICNPPFCPIVPSSPWCVNRQATDCIGAVPGGVCLPYQVTVDAAGVIDVQLCDCHQKDCGPVVIVDIPILPAPFLFCLQDKCPGLSDKCEIHLDGVAQGAIAIASTDVSPGQVVTCDCVSPPVACGNSAYPVCGGGTCPPNKTCKANLGTQTCQCKQILDPVDVALKSYDRALGIVFPSTSAGTQTAYRVTLSSLYHPGDPQPVNQPDFSARQGEVRYLNLYRDANGVPVTDCLSSAAFATTYPCVSVGCAPEFADWGTLFGGMTVYASGNAIIPDSAYTVAHLASSCVGNEATCSDASVEVPFTTSRYGDSQPDGSINVTDVVNTVDVVKQIFGSLLEYHVYMRREIPAPHLDAVNVTDIVLHVDALKLVAYALPVNACP